MNYTFSLIACLLTIASCAPVPKERPVDSGVSGVMDGVITRLYRQVPAEEYDAIDQDFMLDFLTEDEEQILATRYQYFTTNVPVVVSLMRDRNQKTVPFWLEPAGFVRTGQTVKSESYEYEVWQKEFPAGKVELGINGFDKHRPVYFISVAPTNETDSLNITDLYPDEYAISEMREGAFTYHDWSDLELIEVPESLEGQKLFTTVRGRAREAHVIGAFRKTPYPSSEEPDHVLLSWSDAPETTMDVQWRADSATSRGVVRYWNSMQPGDTLSMDAAPYLMQDRMLMNDRYVKRFTAFLKNLKPDTKYFYRVGAPETNRWSKIFSFKTAPSGAQQFSFIWFGDTHCFPDTGRLVNVTRNHRDIAFYTIAGDIVSTGLNRDDWDKFFQHSGDAFSNTPLIPVPGNHDRQDGLGAKMYYDLFSLPKNGPKDVDEESTYAFEYGNALFLMIDATSDWDAHTPWIEEKLKNSNAVWKFAVFHFPPYNYEEPYLELQEKWVPLFDRYHVDMVMSGHIHYYMRSHPMNNGKVVDSFDKGTVYTISISIPAHHENMAGEPYAVTQYPDGYYYQHMTIDGNVLKYVTYDENGTVRDEFTIRK